jgi:hypothetical protein
MKFALNLIWMVLVGFILVGVYSSPTPPTPDESGELLWCFSVKKQALSDPNNEFTDEISDEDASILEFGNRRCPKGFIFTSIKRCRKGPFKL